jgi:hypothetical protein
MALAIRSLSRCLAAHEAEADALIAVYLVLQRHMGLGDFLHVVVPF